MNKTNFEYTEKEVDEFIKNGVKLKPFNGESLDVLIPNSVQAFKEGKDFERKRIFYRLDYALCYGINSHISEEEIEKVKELLKYLLDNKIKATIYRDSNCDISVQKGCGERPEGYIFNCGKECPKCEDIHYCDKCKGEQNNLAHYCDCGKYLGHRGFCSDECHDKYYNVNEVKEE